MIVVLTFCYIYIQYIHRCDEEENVTIFTIILTLGFFSHLQLDSRIAE